MDLLLQLRSLFTAVQRATALNRQVETGTRNRTVQRKSNQSVLLYAASFFDIDACGLDLITQENVRSNNTDLLIHFVVVGISDLESNEYRQYEDYKAPLLKLQKIMVNELKIRRKEPKHALRWWQWIENSTVNGLRRNKQYAVSIFIDFARALLSIQSLFASAEGMFSNGGYQEGVRRQNEESTITEMLPFIRNHVCKRLKQRNKQSGFITGQVDSVQEVAKEIARSTTVVTSMNT